MYGNNLVAVVCKKVPLFRLYVEIPKKLSRAVRKSLCVMSKIDHF